MTDRERQVVLLWSGGKDSVLALAALRAEGRSVAALVTTCTREFDRVSMHGVRRSLLQRQAEALGLPLHEVFITTGAGNAEYEDRMGASLRLFRDRGIRQVACGDIFLDDLREYRERQMQGLGMACVFPIWKRDTRELVETFIRNEYRAVTVCIDLDRLDESFVGRAIDAKFVASLPAGADPCGEYGEFHSFVCDAPEFAEPIPVQVGETVRRDSFLFCDLVLRNVTPESVS